MFISCIILDDEEPSIRHLAKCVAKNPFLDLKASFSDPHAAIMYLQANPVDLIFVDIEMPNFTIDGLDVMSMLGDQQKYIVTTAYPQYALDAFNHSVIDFLHKPFDFERFSRAVQKVHAVLRLERDNVIAPAQNEFTYIRSEGKHRRIYFEDIFWIEADRNTSTIFIETDQINTPLSILSLEKQLPRGPFLRVHKSYVISCRKIDFIEREQIGIKRGETLKLLSIGEPYRKTFMEFVNALTLKSR